MISLQFSQLQRGKSKYFPYLPAVAEAQGGSQQKDVVLIFPVIEHCAGDITGIVCDDIIITSLITPATGGTDNMETDCILIRPPKNNNFMFCMSNERL